MPLKVLRLLDFAKLTLAGTSVIELSDRFVPASVSSRACGDRQQPLRSSQLVPSDLRFRCITPNEQF